MKTSHKKNRPFDFKLIDLVECQPVLYKRQMGLTTYEAMKAKNIIWKNIAQEMQAPIEFCVMRWSNLRGQFQKELRNCRELCPKEGVIRGSTWPYLERLHFLEGTLQSNKPKRVRLTAKATVETAEDDDCEANVLSKDCALSTDMNPNEHDEIVEEDWDYVEEDTVEADHCTTASIDTEFSKPVGYVDETADGKEIDFQLNAILETIDSVNRLTVERRIMAFLCKCQLRALSGKIVDDLDV